VGEDGEATTPGSDDRQQQIAKLRASVDEGVIHPAEYELRRRQILGQGAASDEGRANRTLIGEDLNLYKESNPKRLALGLAVLSLPIAGVSIWGLSSATGVGLLLAVVLLLISLVPLALAVMSWREEGPALLVNHDGIDFRAPSDGRYLGGRFRVPWGEITGAYAHEEHGENAYGEDATLGWVELDLRVPLSQYTVQPGWLKRHAGRPSLRLPNDVTLTTSREELVQVIRVRAHLPQPDHEAPQS
jgi:hypothetical protein